MRLNRAQTDNWHRNEPNAPLSLRQWMPSVFLDIVNYLVSLPASLFFTDQIGLFFDDKKFPLRNYGGEFCFLWVVFIGDIYCDNQCGWVGGSSGWACYSSGWNAVLPGPECWGWSSGNCFAGRCSSGEYTGCNYSCLEVDALGSLSDWVHYGILPGILFVVLLLLLSRTIQCPLLLILYLDVSWPLLFSVEDFCCGWAGVSFLNISAKGSAGPPFVIIIVLSSRGFSVGLMSVSQTKSRDEFLG